jgi:hypothetical protein
MKVTIEYDGNEEQQEIQVALDGYKWKNAMWELDQELRKVTKYGSSLLPHVTLASKQEIVVAEAVREYLRHILNNYNLNLD